MDKEFELSELSQYMTYQLVCWHKDDSHYVLDISYNEMRRYVHSKTFVICPDCGRKHSFEHSPLYGEDFIIKGNDDY